MSGPTPPRVLNRHCASHEVNEIRNRLRRDGISDAEVAKALGCSRTQWNQMLNERQPMRTVYRWAVLGYLMVRKKNERLSSLLP